MCNVVGYAMLGNKTTYRIFKKTLKEEKASFILACNEKHTEALEGHFYLLLITYYLLLITYYLLLTTYYLLLTTYYLSYHLSPL